MNKYMHPRNIYKTRPDFKELAIAYPEFRSYAKQDITGKVVIDFKDQASIRALTTTLLKKDFGLSVVIPPDRLVPTLPLRLNYLLWIEDLLSSKKSSTSCEISGIDIGTGATSIYSILAAKSNKWRMLATEVDSFSLECARKNIEQNNLHTLIKVKQVLADTVLIGALEDEGNYDFCMFNPPFFGTEQELDASSKSRSAARPLPHNARTGALGEVVTEGGEVALVSQMIRESKELKTKIGIYTTMVGQKSSLGPLKRELANTGAVSTTQTEFCQGHTTRWGLAWTYLDNVDFEIIEMKTGSRKLVKKKLPLKYIVPKSCSLPEYTISCVSTKLIELLSKLKMNSEEVTDNKHEKSYCVTAFENTWTNQRRKRRCIAVQTDNLPYSLGGHVGEDIINPEHSSLKRPRTEDSTELEAEATSKKSRLEGESEETGSVGHCEDSLLLKAMLLVKKVSSEINIELSWLEGASGKDAVHQVLQYLRNNFK